MFKNFLKNLVLISNFVCSLDAINIILNSDHPSSSNPESALGHVFIKVRTVENPAAVWLEANLLSAIFGSTQ